MDGETNCRKRVLLVKQPEISERTKEKLTGFKINNLPKNITKEKMVKFLTENGRKRRLLSTEEKFHKSNPILKSNKYSHLGPRIYNSGKEKKKC